MITTVIFDIGNVLVDFSWKEKIAAFGYDEELQVRIANASVHTEDWNQYDIGILSDEQIVNLFVENDPEIGEEIKRTFSDLKGIVKQRSYAKDLIKKLKDAGLRVLYLSNFSYPAEHDCATELDFIPLTDGGILSYKEKMIKPDARIYELLTKRYELVPEECVFLDDTLRNIEAASVHGYKTIHFVDVKTGLSQLEELLKIRLI